jgi:hypothetical protein
VHISSNQRCRNFHDPRNASQPLNFNFLPTYATPKLGILPHTVQVCARVCVYTYVCMYVCVCMRVYIDLKLWKGLCKNPPLNQSTSITRTTATTQAYALDDPTAGVYGQRNFSEMHAYMLYETKEGRRHVHFYPETSYWVNVDIDVPLFLPTYAERRLHDFRLLAHEEDKGRAGGNRIAGSLMFDSGWEWGYWLSDVLVAASMWDPTRWDDDGPPKATATPTPTPTPTDDSSSSSSSSDDSCPSTKPPLPLPQHLRRFERQVHDHALRALPTRFRGPLARWLADLTHFQHETLLLGRLGPGRPCPNQATLSGIAYLIGKDTWVELPRWLNLGFTQPNYVGMYDHADPDYRHVRPLLARMQDEAGRLHATVEGIVAEMEMEQKQLQEQEQEQARMPAALLERVRELRDAMRLLSLRAQHVALLYEATSPEVLTAASSSSSSSSSGSGGGGGSGGQEAAAAGRRAALLLEARGVLEAATAVVRAREARYQAPLGRVAGWRENPTVYHFDFLWTVKSLYYWWREQGQAEARSWAARYSWCYLNRMQPTEVALGVGKNVLKVVRDVASWVPGAHFWADCLAPPTREFEFPRDL